MNDYVYVNFSGVGGECRMGFERFTLGSTAKSFACNLEYYRKSL